LDYQALFAKRVAMRGGRATLLKRASNDSRVYVSCEARERKAHV
jgi:hypothetical protein